MDLNLAYHLTERIDGFNTEDQLGGVSRGRDFNPEIGSHCENKGGNANEHASDSESDVQPDRPAGLPSVNLISANTSGVSINAEVVHLDDACSTDVEEASDGQEKDVK